jgi:mRNA interferase RelE/StbE
MPLFARGIHAGYIFRMKEVRYLRPAAKSLAKLPADVRARIMAKIAAYAVDPSKVAGSVKALQGIDALRLRIDDYRAIFRVVGDRIEVAKVGHRREIYD